MEPNDCAIELTQTILELAEQSIGRQIVKEPKSTHPWMTQEIIECIAAKHAAEGTPDEERLTQLCSDKILATRSAYISKTKGELKKMKQGPKLLWKKVSFIFAQRGFLSFLFDALRFLVAC